MSLKVFVSTFFELVRRFNFVYLILPGQHSRIQPLSASKSGVLWGGSLAFWRRKDFSQYIFVSSVLWDCKKITIIFRSFLPNSLAWSTAPTLSRCLLGETLHLRTLKVGIYYSNLTWSLKSLCFSFNSGRNILLGLNLSLSPLLELVNTHGWLKFILEMFSLCDFSLLDFSSCLCRSISILWVMTFT